MALLVAVALAQRWQRRAPSATLCYGLGAWGVGSGVGSGRAGGRPDFRLFHAAPGRLVGRRTWRGQASPLLTRRY